MAIPAPVRTIRFVLCSALIVSVARHSLGSAVDADTAWKSLGALEYTIGNARRVISACEDFVRSYPNDTRVEDVRGKSAKLVSALKKLPGMIRTQGIPFANGYAVNLAGAGVFGGRIDLKRQSQGLMAPLKPGNPPPPHILRKRSSSFQKLSMGVKFSQVAKLLGHPDDMFEQVWPRTGYERVCLYERDAEHTAILWFDKNDALTFAYGTSVANTENPESGSDTVKPVDRIPTIESDLIASIKSKSAKNVFVIKDIRPVGRGQTEGRICIAGKGSLPVSKGTRERLGEGVILELISPIQRGAKVNIQKGKAGVRLKHRKLDHSPIFSVGAIWEKIPLLMHDNKDGIDPMNGVAFVPGIRLGALYEGDGHLMFDYVKAGDQVIHFPAGTAGSVHRFAGQITVGRYVFISKADPVYPLTFLLTSDGYVYLRGRGKVIFPTFKVVNLGKAQGQSP